MSHLLIKHSLCLALLAAVTGCRSTPPPAPAVKAQPAAPSTAGMTDEQIVRAHTADGLGLGLRVDGAQFPLGTQIPMHILMEDFAARTAIASGMCSGFTLTYDETTTHISGTREINNPRCFGSIPSPDEIPLDKGKVKAVEISQRNASNMDIPAGTYTLTVTWNAVPVGKATILNRPAYTTLQSNPVQVTVTP